MTPVPIAQPIIGEEEKAAVIGVLESGNIAQGEKVAEFKRRLPSTLARNML